MSVPWTAVFTSRGGRHQPEAQAKDGVASEFGQKRDRTIVWTGWEPTPLHNHGRQCLEVRVIANRIEIVLLLDVFAVVRLQFKSLG